MSTDAAVAVIWWWLGIIPAGVVAWRRKGTEGWPHVLVRALWWPLFLMLALLGLNAWDDPQEERP